MTEKDLLHRYWYYAAELGDGLVTPGKKHANLALVRRLLRSIDIRGADCIDIGTQEAVIPLLLKKAGASRTVAYDRLDLEEKVTFLKEKYSVSFDYYAGLQLMELPDFLDKNGGRFFDLVVFSGVLYHMINPLGLLGLIRGFCRIGGYFVVETVAIVDAEEKLVFNAGGKRYGPSSNYFIATTGWLEYVLRMLGLRPLAAVYTGSLRRPFRLAIVCRSEEKPCPLASDDDWVFKGFHEDIFRDESLVDWERLSHTRSEVSFEPAGNDIVRLSYGDLSGNLARIPSYRCHERKMMLTLDSAL